MNFKSLLLVFVFTFSGCSDFIKGKKSTDHVITVEENEACLKKFPVVFDKYLESKIDGEEIDEALGCLNSTLTRFQSKFRGQQAKDVFSIDDITTIFNFFFKDLKISRDTSEKLVRFKFALIGGSSDSLSKIDVENLKEFLKDLSVELKSISKWVAVFRSDNGSLPESSIKSAFGQLRTSLINLINSGHISKTQYSVEDFLMLLKQFNFNLKPYSEQIDQLLIVKTFLIGEDYVKSKESYIAAIELILDIMQLNSMIENHHFKFNLKKQDTQQPLNDLIAAGLQIIKNSPRMKAEKELHLQTLKELIKFESPLLKFENLLIIKVILVGGKPDVLTLTEVNLFEKSSKEIIAGAYRAMALLDIKSVDQFLAASPELQSTLKTLFETTHVEDFLVKPEFSTKIFESLQGFLKTQTDGTASKVDIYQAFTEIADPGTFSSKQNVLQFLSVITSLLDESQKFSKSSDNKNWTTKLQTARTIISELQELISLKGESRLNAEALVKSFDSSEDGLTEAKDTLRIFFPKMSLTSLGVQDLQKLQDLLQLGSVELKTLTKWPETPAEFEIFKKSLKPILAATDFYTGLHKTHEMIGLIVKSIPRELGDSKSLKDFLTLLVADREIRSFEEISSTMDTLFSAYQLSKKVSSNQAKFGLETIRDFVSVLLVSDAVHAGKRLDINQLIGIIQSFPQASAVLPQINIGLKYLKILFPKLQTGFADEVVVKKIFDFILILSKEKINLSKWPETVEARETYKKSIELILAATDFYTGQPKAHELFKILLNAAIENSPEFNQKIGQKRSLVFSVIPLLIADREIKSFVEINSILDTSFAGLEFYKQISSTNLNLNGELVKRVLDFLMRSDHMQVHKFVRMDMIIQLVNRIEPSLLKQFNVSEADVLALKANLFGGVSTELTMTDINSLTQLMILFERKSNLSLKTTDPKKMIQFFTNPESVKVFSRIFNPNSSNESVGLAHVAGQLFKLTTTLIKVKSEIDVALETRDFKSTLPSISQLIDELLKLPLYQKSGVLDLQILKTMLKDSLDIEITLSASLLELKRYLVGGVAHQISRADLVNLQKIVLFVNKNYTEVFKAAQVLYFDKTPTYALEEIDQAAQVFKEKVIEFLQLTQVTKAGLTLPEFIKLVQPLLVQHAINLDLNLVTTGQELLVGPYFDYSPEHFRMLVNTYVDVLQVIRYAQMGFVKLEIKERSQFLITMSALDRLFNIFENSIAYQVGKKFEAKHFDTILAHLLKKGLFPYKVSPQILASFYKRMLNTVFSKPRVNSDQLEFITAQQFIGLKNELILFKYFIHVIDGAITETQYSPQQVAAKNVNLKWSIERQMIKFAEAYKVAFSHQPDFFKRAISVYKAEIMQDKPVVFFNGYVISHNQIDFYSSWTDQIRTHYVRTLARLLLQGWGGKEGSEITSEGLVKWYADFKEFGVAIKNFDPRSGNSGERSMLEANLFTYSGNGDKKLNFTEATQYIALLMTGGGLQFTQVYDLAQKANCLTNQLDPVGFNYVKESCIISVYVQNYERIFSNMNWFVAVIRNMKDNSERYQFFHEVMLVSRNPLNKTQDLESLDLRTMNMILIYIESVFMVIDSDQNYTLSPDEIRAKQAYARFDNLVYSIAEKRSPELLRSFAEDKMKWICRQKGSTEFNKHYLAREAFIYMIYNGHEPKEKDFFSWSGFSDTVGTAWSCGWNDGIFKFEGEVDRKMMINTFKLLKSVLASE